MPRIVYLPIEPYKSRYTQYTSVKDGVYETCFKELGIDFVSIRPDETLRVVRQGQVLDVGERTNWGFAQISRLVEMICKDEFNEGDVIFLEDFWTPGFEMIPYAQCSKYGNHPMNHIPVYAFCHAQTIDPNDFTHPWQYWMRPLEKVWFDYCTKIFCASEAMLPYFEKADVPIFRSNRQRILPVGHAFHKEVMLKIAHTPVPMVASSRFPLVIYASRFDQEKNPGFFLDLVEEVIYERPEVQFAICTGQPKLSSNNPELLERLFKLKCSEYVQRHGSLRVHTNLDLCQYYTFLCSAKVLINTAIQDWISYVLLDGAINGCLPLFPKWLSFPEALNNDSRFLYENMDLLSAKQKLYTLLDTKEEINLEPIYSKYTDSVKRMCRHMGFKV